MFIWTRRLTDVIGLRQWRWPRYADSFSDVPECGAPKYLPRNYRAYSSPCLTIVFILQNRHHVAKRLRGGRAGQTEETTVISLRARQMADIWHVPALILCQRQCMRYGRSRLKTASARLLAGNLADDPRSDSRQRLIVQIAYGSGRAAGVCVTGTGGEAALSQD